MTTRKTRVSPGGAAARLARWRWHRNPSVCGAYAGPVYRLADGDTVTAAQLRRMFAGKIPGPKSRRLLGIVKVTAKWNPRSGRLPFRSRASLWPHDHTSPRPAPRSRLSLRPRRGRKHAAATARARIVSRATLRARINKASGGARNAVMRSILAQVLAGKVKIRGARISAAVNRGIRRGRRNPKRKYVFTRARRLALKKARYIRARGW